MASVASNRFGRACYLVEAENALQLNHAEARWDFSRVNDTRTKWKPSMKTTLNASHARWLGHGAWRGAVPGDRKVQETSRTTSSNLQSWSNQNVQNVTKLWEVVRAVRRPGLVLSHLNAPPPSSLDGCCTLHQQLQTSEPCDMRTKQKQCSNSLWKNTGYHWMDLLNWAWQPSNHTRLVISLYSLFICFHLFSHLSELRIPTGLRGLRTICTLWLWELCLMRSKAGSLKNTLQKNSGHHVCSVWNSKTRRFFYRHCQPSWFNM